MNPSKPAAPLPLLANDEDAGTATFLAFEAIPSTQRKLNRYMAGALLVGVGAVLAFFVDPYSWWERALRVGAWTTLGVGLLACLIAVTLFFTLFSRLEVWLLIGAEGLRVVGPRARTATYAYEDIREVRLEGHSVSLELTSGARVSFDTLTAFVEEDRTGRGDASLFMAHVARARAAYASSGGVSALVDLLARGERDVASWRAALVRLRTDGGTYRTIGVSRDALWRVLEDPTQVDTARAAAAWVLRETLDEESKKRLRVAAETSHAVNLRVVLDAMLEEGGEPAEQDARVDRALASMERESR